MDDNLAHVIRPTEQTDLACKPLGTGTSACKAALGQTDFARELPGTATSACEAPLEQSLGCKHSHAGQTEFACKTPWDRQMITFNHPRTDKVHFHPPWDRQMLGSPHPWERH